ncbi:Acylamino-acid-releasing enzyme [Hypsibius exemplaris]|uniref:Acylamino-acid-releasing enzyme n=1 Tax=Hypsibius exemplaris TaxID=2072580 RepID=A0A1W0X0K8_HYPEX|nr:Acylamino-acid-releasing enzyme [Hypsibius exemplaris]
MADVTAEYQAVARIPTPISAFIANQCADDGKIPTGDHSSPRSFLVRATWSQRDLVRMEKSTTLKSYLVKVNRAGVVEKMQLGVGTDNSSEKVVAYSKDGSLKAVLTKFKPKKSDEEKEVIEIHSSVGKVATNDLTATKRHGKFYFDGELGSFHLAPSEDRESTHVLYVAEKYHPKSDSFFSVIANQFPDDPELRKKSIGTEFEYRDDWGEQLQKKNQPVMCILDWNDNHVSILQNIPEGISPGQPIWTPDGTGVVFVGYDHAPERLGLVYCPIRKSRLYHLAIGQSKMALPLTFIDLAVRTPRFSPDGKSLIYLETEVGGPHFRALRLMKIDCSAGSFAAPSVVVPVPESPVKATDFPGLYSQTFPTRCWSADNKRVVMSTAWRSTHQIIAINVKTKAVISLTTGDLIKTLPKWEVLDVSDDLIIASASSPSVCPRVYCARLPEAGAEASIVWTLLDQGGGTDVTVDKEVGLIDWGVEVIKHKKSGLDFEAIWVRPSLKQKHPVILWPHGGPHSVIAAGFDIFVHTLVRLDFAVIFVNYRGSVGFGESNLRSLLGKIGENDVEDCFRALDVLLGKWNLTEGETDILVQGGSHGGFLAAHLIGQFPGIFRACCLRNPVINLASMFGTTDIPDWTYVEAGFDYHYDNPPITPPYLELLKHSPIAHAEKVTTPTLILLGEKDRRVPPGQGMEFYRALKLLNVPTKVIRYPECDHPIAEVDAESDSFVHMVKWFQQFGRK